MRIFQFTGIWMKIFREVSAIVMLSTTSCLRAVASPGWTVSDRIPVGGDGNWDYATLQAEQHRLYVAHQDRLVVIDLATRTEIRSIPGQKIHGVALVPELNRGFVSDGDAGSVILFDLKTLELNRTIQAQPDADAICYEPVTRRIFTFNGDSRNTTIIDAVRAQIVGSLSLDGQPEFAQTDGRGAIFVNIEDKDEVLKIDAPEPKSSSAGHCPRGAAPAAWGLTCSMIASSSAAGIRLSWSSTASQGRPWQPFRSENGSMPRSTIRCGDASSPVVGTAH